jgi:hypothetical protein
MDRTRELRNGSVGQVEIRPPERKDASDIGVRLVYRHASA